MSGIGRLATALSLCLAVSSCGRSESEREAETMKQATPQRVQAEGTIRLSDQDRAALGLTVAVASEADLPDSTLRFGRVLSPAPNEAHVVSPVTGRITHPPMVQLGETVASGATIVEVIPILDAPDRISVGTQTAQRQGDIEAAERELATAEAEAARARTLSPQIVSAAKLQEAETVVATARARLEGLRQARTVSADVQTRPVAVRAPIAGAVVAITAPVGTVVKSGDVLAEILKPGPLWIDLSVPPDEPPGDRYEIVMSTETVPGRLLARGRVTDSDGTRHDRLIVDARQAASLTPGGWVSVRVSRGAGRGVVLPDSAIVPGVESDTVFVETSAGVFAARAVRVDARFGGQARLGSGVNAGERIVVGGAMALQGERMRAQLRPQG